MLVTLVVLLGSSVLGDPFHQDLQYVVELRQSQFYRLAEVHAQRMLARTDLDAQARSQIVVELSKTNVAQALNRRGSERASAWSRAVQVLTDESRASSDPILRIVLQVQRAFVEGQRATWSVREANLRDNSEDLWLGPRSQLRSVIQQLMKLEEVLKSADVRNQPSFSSARRQSLLRNLQARLADAYQHQAITYAHRPADRTRSLTQALSYYQDLAAARQVDDVTWKGRIGQIRCLRLLKQYTEAQRQLQRWSAAPVEQLGSLAAESIRLAMDTQQSEVALRLASRSSFESESPEFQLASVEALVAAAIANRGRSDVALWRERALQITADLSRNHGVYWALRAEMELSRLALDPSAKPSTLGTAAETLLRQDAPDSAKEMFLKAANQAQQEGESSEAQAFDFLYKAAVVDHRQGNLADAISRFRDVALKYIPHPRAAEAHMLAVFDAAALYQQRATQEKTNQNQPDAESSANAALAQYEDLLQEHLEHWPEQSPANQVRIWSAKLAMAKRQWHRAINLYQGVEQGSAQEVEAYQGLSQAMKRGRATKKIDSETQGQVLLWMQDRAKAAKGDVAHRLALSIGNVALQSFGTKNPQYTLARETLYKHWTNTESTATMRREIGVPLLVAAVGDTKMDLANEVFAQLVPIPPANLLEILKGLEHIRRQRRDDDRLRRLTVELLDLITPYEDEMSDADRRVVRRAAADYAPLSKALAAYAQFALEEPKEFPVQRRYAELLSASNTREHREQALQQWRRIVRLAEPQSQDWFNAKCAVANTLFQMGERKEAKALVDYLSALYPELGGKATRTQFEELRAKF